jgi:very-short-patch-repair endonuclease
VNAAAAGLCVDCTWRGHRLVAEIDSWRYHRARDAFDRDRDRDVDLALAGFVVARFTDRMLDREPGRVAARVKALLAATALGRSATAPGAP